MASPNLKTWIEISKAAVQKNIKTIRRLLRFRTKLFAVVKSNAYGHGLVTFSQLADRYGVDGFCVDSVIEGERLRQGGIKKPILVLGPTFKTLFKDAVEKKITITVSNSESLQEWLKSRHKPEIHLKIDTGMHRQGFYVQEFVKVLKQIQNSKSEIRNLIRGVYTHFASAKDVNYPTFTEKQFGEFQKVIKILERAGFKNLTKHAAATGGTLVNSKYHLDAVRIGIGLYGLWPSLELAVQLPKIKFEPVLSWHTLISEIKNLKPGDYVGYDFTERLIKPTTAAVLPIGYWHGFPRALSSIGELLINGHRARVLGRVSMDMIVVDVTGIKCRRGTKATIIGRQKSDGVSAYELGRKLGASYYEILTRTNPLMERLVK